jgi:hypothetical protein
VLVVDVKKIIEEIKPLEEERSLTLVKGTYSL